MRHTPSAVATLALALAVLSPGTATSQTFAAVMSGGVEVPAGSPVGSGVASITISGTTINFAISVQGIGTPTAAHIHQAAAGVPGPVVVPLTAPASGTGTSVGTVTAAQDVVNGILANPSGYYVNVHTADFPAGALRGQLNVGESSTVVRVATLRAEGEAPNPGKTTAGGIATITLSGTTITYSILVDGITAATGAHIHRGLDGLSGPVVVPFNATVTNGLISGTTTAAPELVRDIIANPTNYYVNVHTSDFPGGAIRGALDQRAEPSVYFPTVVKSAGLNGTEFVSDLRILNPTAVQTNVRAEFFAAKDAGLTGPTATFQFPIAAGAQAVVDDVLKSLFNTSGSGALRITTDFPVNVTSRVLNDQRDLGDGTTGLLVPGSSIAGARVAGYLPLLSQASASDVAAHKDFRTNVGWFNPGSAAATVTFKAMKNDGTLIATGTVTVNGLAKGQRSIFDLFPTTEPALLAQQDFYISYSSTAGVFVYATVVDNLTGDGLYEDGAPAR